MRITDYSNFFTIEKKFRGVGNIRTPEVAYRTVGWGVGTAIVAGLIYWMVLARIVDLFPLPTLAKVALAVIVVGGVTVFVAKAATNRLKHEKELLDLVLSWVKFLTRPKRHVDFRPWNPPTSRPTYMEYQFFAQDNSR